MYLGKHTLECTPATILRRIYLCQDATSKKSVEMCSVCFRVTLSIDMTTDWQERNVYHRTSTVATASIPHDEPSLDESGANGES